MGLIPQEFLWFRTMVGSRNFGITINGVRRTAMVPLADMLNHFRHAETHWEFDDNISTRLGTTGGFVIKATQNIGANVQVMDSYGPKTNTKYLLHYGFIVENNSEIDTLTKVAFVVDALDINEDLNSNLQCYGACRVFRKLRKHAANKEERENYDDFDKFVCKRNEMAMLAYFSNECRKILATYKHSYMTNKHNLRKKPKFSNLRNIYYILSHEQSILWFYVNFTKQN